MNERENSSVVPPLLQILPIQRTCYKYETDLTSKSAGSCKIYCKDMLLQIEKTPTLVLKLWKAIYIQHRKMKNPNKISHDLWNCHFVTANAFVRNKKHKVHH